MGLMGAMDLGELTRNLDAATVVVLLGTLLAFLVPVVLILPPVPLQKSDALRQTHTQAGLEPAKSRLRTQHAAAEHAPRPDGRPPTLQSLVVYPVKSCRGIEVARAKVVPQGLEYDRVFTFAQLKSPFPVPAAVDASDSSSSDDDKEKEKEAASHAWEFITQRQFARLATVAVDLWLPDEMKLRKQSIQSDEAFLILRFPWKERGLRGLLDTVAAKLVKGWRAEPEREVLIPVNFPSAAEIDAQGYTFEPVRVWKDTVTALNLEKELPEELRLYLGVSNKLGLFRIDPAGLREVHRCAPSKAVAGYQPVAAFQDAYPVNLMSLTSFQQFQSEVPKDNELKQLNVLRFRPNLIISGAPEYDEETWKQIRLKPGTSGLYNDAVFHVSCRTTRCKLPNVDPESGARHAAEPDRSLRRLRAVDAGAPLSGCLGMQVTPLFDDKGSRADDEDRHGWVCVGMTLEVEERGEHVTIK